MDTTLSAGRESGIRRLLLALAHAGKDARRVRVSDPHGPAGARTCTRDTPRIDERLRGSPERFVPGFYGDSRFADLTARRETFELYRLLSGHDNPA